MIPAMDNHALAATLIKKLAASKLHVTTVESCTGGALANAITDIPGASDVFQDGFITYSNQSKIALGVKHETIKTHSVYSLETAAEMAATGLRASSAGADISIGVTGSLSRVDPRNAAASKVGQIFVVALRGRQQLFGLTLNVPQNLNRPEAKSFIVSKVLEELISSI